MSLKEKLSTGYLYSTMTTILGGSIGITTGGFVTIRAILYAGFGALGGEALDWTPYLGTAIPEGFAYMRDIFSNTDNGQTRDFLIGNLDKVGATLGFLSSFVSRTHIHNIRTESPTPQNPARHQI